jgi:hypothetical protein
MILWGLALFRGANCESQANQTAPNTNPAPPPTKQPPHHHPTTTPPPRGQDGQNRRPNLPCPNQQTCPQDATPPAEGHKTVNDSTISLPPAIE